MQLEVSSNTRVGTFPHEPSISPDWSLMSVTLGSCLLHSGSLSNVTLQHLIRSCVTVGDWPGHHSYRRNPNEYASHLKALHVIVGASSVLNSGACKAKTLHFFALIAH